MNLVILSVAKDLVGSSTQYTNFAILLVFLPGPLSCSTATAKVKEIVYWRGRVLSVGPRMEPSSWINPGYSPGTKTMLVLSRKVGQRIFIGDQIAVTVVRVAQGAVRIGIEAPDHLTIVREEIKQDREEKPQQRKLVSGS